MSYLNFARILFLRLPKSVQTLIRESTLLAHSKKLGNDLAKAGIVGLEQNDINHVLHYLRGQELQKLPKGVNRFISVGCSGTWYFQWIEDCCGPIGRHIGVEYYSPKPSDLPPNTEWIVNTASDMSSIEHETGDILFSGQNLEHLWPDEVAGFLLESHRVLKMGGILVVDSPNRLVTQRLCWSHPEHTIELSPDEARDLIESSGFKVTAMRGMWLCVDAKTNQVLPFAELQNIKEWPIARRIEEAYNQLSEAFSWWIEAKKIDRQPDKKRTTEIIQTIFQKAWQERTNRFLTVTGKTLNIEGQEWLSSNGTAGALMYGPYMPLPAGSYCVRMELRLSKSYKGGDNIALLEVIAGSGDDLATKNINAEQLHSENSTFIELNFCIKEMTFGIQFRAIVTSDRWVMIRRAIDLTCLTNEVLSSHLLSDSCEIRSVISGN